MWSLNKEQLLKIINNWDIVEWTFSHKSKPFTFGNFHSTAPFRSKISSPVEEYIKLNGKPKGRILYYGVGRNIITAKELNAICYDPHHPDPMIKIKPEGKFDEIHSHYVLNVVNKDEALEIMNDFYRLLNDTGSVLISVRRDRRLMKNSNKI